jgi:hypothetical protein
MTPPQLAQSECANCLPDGSCLGMGFGDKGNQTPLWSKLPSRCVIADNQPCQYFEECVLAGIPMISNERKASEWQEAEDKYGENKREHERRLGKDDLERGRDHGTPGLHKEAGPASHPGGRPSGDPIGARFLRLSGRGLAQVDRKQEIQSRVSRIPA